MRFTLSLLFILSALICFGQQKPNTTGKQKPRKIRQIYSGKIQKIPGKYDGNLLLTDSVVLEHRGAILKADSVVLDEINNVFKAFSNVKLDQAQNHLVCDSMDYNGNTSIGKATGNVVLRDPQQTLYTDQLIYNRITNKAYYDSGGTIVSKDNVINSKVGIYDLTTKSNTFDDDVQITNDDYIIQGKNVIYHSDGDYMEFNDETFIQSRKDPKDFILTDKGRYYLGKKEAILESRSSVHSGGRTVTANRLNYLQESGYGKAIGDVVIEDPEENRWIKGDFAEVFKELDSAYVTQNAVAVKAFEKDSLYIHADTLMATKRNDKGLIRAFYGARYYKSNIQGKADSIAYAETDGIMRFYRDPVVWSGYRQITGDTIVVYSNVDAERLDSISVLSNAFAISKRDSLTQTDFNQLKSRKMLGIFVDDNLDWVQAEGNAQSLVFMEDEDKKTKIKELIGINTSDCGIIEADLELRELNVISCRIGADSEFYPPSKLAEEKRKLPNFIWREKERPLRWQDIFLKVENVSIENSTEDNESQSENSETPTEELELMPVEKDSPQTLEAPNTKK